MDTDRVVEVLPHYVVMGVLIFLALAALRAAVGGVDLWVELAVAVGVVVAYQYLVTALGVGPSAWE